MTTRILAALAALVCLATAEAQPAGSDEHWVATWGTAQQLGVETRPPWVAPPPRVANEPPPTSPIPPFPPSLTAETVRMVVRTSVGGSRLRLTLSNAAGIAPVRVGEVHVALHERDSEIIAASDRRVTFGGHPSFTGATRRARRQ